ncbi:MAG: DUF2069 domain-containing protein [Endozoicomonas sp.]
MAANQNLGRKADISYKVSIFLYLGLTLTVLAETLWLNRPQGSVLAISAILTLPLLMPLPGMLKKQPRAAAWLCFILCFYFMSGVMKAWFDSARPTGWLMTGFSSLLFVTGMMFIRWQSQRLRLNIGL